MGKTAGEFCGPGLAQSETSSILMPLSRCTLFPGRGDQGILGGAGRFDRQGQSFYSPKMPWLFEVNCPAESNPAPVPLPAVAEFSAPLPVLEAVSPGESRYDTIPKGLATSAKMSAALSNCSRLCVALTMARNRALPSATTG
jgi:hypothetical protein